jgi:hypothetical protein
MEGGVAHIIMTDAILVDDLDEEVVRVDLDLRPHRAVPRARWVRDPLARHRGRLLVLVRRLSWR